MFQPTTFESCGQVVGLLTRVDILRLVQLRDEPALV
jgi:hypothetical protein